MTTLRSRDNPRIRRWRALAHDGRSRVAEGCALLEGAHLLSAYLERGGRPRAVLVSDSGRAKAEIALLVRRAGVAPVQVPDALLRWIGDAATPGGVAAEIRLPSPDAAGTAPRHAVFLDGVQDAGNVGAILRSAAAFGVEAAYLGEGCADAWSPKVLRAAMGGHFALRVQPVPDLVAALRGFAGTLACADARGGEAPSRLELRGPIGWIFGAEGRGVSTAAAACATLRVRIPLAGAVESLNVAAAAAVLLYERWRQLNTPAARS